MGGDERPRFMSELHSIRHGLGSVRRVLAEEQPDRIVSKAEGSDALCRCIEEALACIDEADAEIDMAINAINSIPEEQEEG
ncbi:MAG: hypothetical protein LBG81_05145 [Coriobacteriaceae bacterium]|jgi:hypothetical protein|nr:hypothetical protein [Coriobacteriaceae bacterium]